MNRECIDCGRETENAQWVDGHYVPLCFACEEERERQTRPSLTHEDDDITQMNLDNRFGPGREP